MCQSASPLVVVVFKVVGPCNGDNAGGLILVALLELFRQTLFLCNTKMR
jgi:hypothetical protein